MTGMIAGFSSSGPSEGKIPTRKRRESDVVFDNLLPQEGLRVSTRDEYFMAYIKNKQV